MQHAIQIDKVILFAIPYPLRVYSNSATCFQENSTDGAQSSDAREQCHQNAKLTKKRLSVFKHNLTPEQYNQIEMMAASDDDDHKPPLLLLAHVTTFQRFVTVVVAYAGPVPPPVGLVLPAVMTQDTLMIAILDFLRGAGTPNPSPAPIGSICLPCDPEQFAMVCMRASRLEASPWLAALIASAPGVAIVPIASLWTTKQRHPKGEMGSIVPLPLPPIALWD